MTDIAVLDDGRESRVPGEIDGDRIILSARALETALGFVAKPEGLCKDDVCIPVREGSGLRAGEDGFDAARLAMLLDRPIAIDADNSVAAVSASTTTRASALQSLIAPDFTLPDLEGRPQSLSDFRGRKVILAAYASW